MGACERVIAAASRLHEADVWETAQEYGVDMHALGRTDAYTLVLLALALESLEDGASWRDG